jgi:hypothetical protein
MCAWDTTEQDVRALAADITEAVKFANGTLPPAETELASVGRSHAD